MKLSADAAKSIHSTPNKNTSGDKQSAFIEPYSMYIIEEMAKGPQKHLTVSALSETINFVEARHNVEVTVHSAEKSILIMGNKEIKLKNQDTLTVPRGQ